MKIIACIIAALLSIATGADARGIGHKEPALAYLIGQQIVSLCGRTEDPLEAGYILAEVNDINASGLTIGDRFYNLAALDPCPASFDWANPGGNILSLTGNITFGAYGGVTYDGATTAIFGAGTWLDFSRQDNEQVCIDISGVNSAASNGIAGLWNQGGAHFQSGSLAMQFTNSSGGNMSLRVNSASSATGFGAGSLGLNCGERASSSAIQYWLNGVAGSTASNSDTTPDSYYVVIGACCSSTSPTYDSGSSTGVYFRPAENQAAHAAFSLIAQNDLIRKGKNGGGNGGNSSCLSSDTSPCEGPTGANYFQQSDIGSISSYITRLCRRNTPPTSAQYSAGRNGTYTKFFGNCVFANDQAKCRGSFATQWVCSDELWADGCNDPVACGIPRNGIKENQIETGVSVTCPIAACAGKTVQVRLGFSNYNTSDGCVIGKTAWMLGASAVGSGGDTGWGYLDLMNSLYGYSASGENTTAGQVWSSYTSFQTAVTNTGQAGGFTACANYAGANCVSWNATYGWLVVYDICVFPPNKAFSAPGVPLDTLTFIGIRWDVEMGDNRPNCTSSVNSACKFVEKGIDVAKHYGSTLSTLMDDLYGSSTAKSGLDGVSLPAILAYMESGTTGSAEDRIFIQLARPYARQPTMQAEWNGELGIVYCLNSPDCTQLPPVTDPGIKHLGIIFGLSGESRVDSVTVNSILKNWPVGVADAWPNNGTEGGQVFYSASGGIACGSNGTGFTPLVNERTMLAFGYPEACPNESF